MYYKITNKENEVFKNLQALRAKELKIEEDNIQAIKEKTGHDFKQFVGHSGQQNFGRVTVYKGFQFINPLLIDLTIWKHSSDFPSEFFFPNKRTKKGREMSDFLSNGLKSSWYAKVYTALGIKKQFGKFVLPYVHCTKDTVILFIDDKYDLTDPNIIEITRNEFNYILNS